MLEDTSAPATPAATEPAVSTTPTAAPAPTTTPAAAPAAAAPAEDTAESIFAKFVNPDGTAKDETKPDEPAKAVPPKGPDGKFITDPAKAATDPAKADEQKLEDKPAAPVAVPAALNFWPKEMKESFAKLTPAEQSFHVQREQQFQRGLSKLGGELKQVREFGKPFADAIAKHEDWFAGKSETPAQTLDNLMTFQKSWEADHVGTTAGLIDQIAQASKATRESVVASMLDRLGIDPTELALRQPERLAPQDPEKYRLKQELVRRDLAIQQEKAQREQLERAQTEEQVGQAMAGIDAFAKDKPHFAALEADINDLIGPLQRRYPQASPHAILNEAYRRAYAASGQVQAQERAAKEAADRAKADADRKAAALKKVDDAKRAAAINISGSPSASADYETGANAILAKYAHVLTG